MPWQQHTSRRTPLPPNWPTIRRHVLTRDDHWCQIKGPRCTGRATDVDHTGPPDDHRVEALRAACRTCHMQRTQAQGQATKPPRQRPTTKHPGLK